VPSLLTIGVWVWGGVLTLIIAGILIAFCVASGRVDGDGKWRESGRWISGLYSVIRANGTVVAALVATLGVAWSWFFQIAYRSPPLN
jgi:hypothetical protein